MRITKVLSLIALFAGIYLLTSCNPNAKNSNYLTTDSGVKYKIFQNSPEQPKLQTGHVLSLKLKYGTKDTTFFDSDNIPDQLMMLEMQPSAFVGDFYEMMSMLSVGDSAEFFLDAESFFITTAGFREIPEFAVNASELVFNVKIEKSQSQQEMQDEMIAEMERMRDDEAQIIREYVAENNYNVEPTSTGLYVVINEQGKGEKPKAGDKVKVHYTGKLLNGIVFDSSVTRGQPFEFPLGQGRVIRGWDEGIAMLNVGSKATLIIPSELGYGERGAGRDIPPFAPLVFEVELIDIVK